MIRVCFDPNSLSPEEKKFFDEWVKTAKRAKENYDGKNFRAKIWSVLKYWLMENFFHDKCAYCEVNIAAGFVGDAEHYRPKGAVEELHGDRLVPVSHDGRVHPGYYWLAYDWENLIPSCTNCNTINGKRTQFPIKKTRVFDPADGPDTTTLNRVEGPVLLHPYDKARDPTQHLSFTPDGYVLGIDDIGKMTVSLLDLNRRALVNHRQQILQTVRGSFGAKVCTIIDCSSDIGSDLDRVEAELSRPELTFSAARRSMIRAIRVGMSIKA